MNLRSATTGTAAVLGGTGAAAVAFLGGTAHAPEADPRPPTANADPGVG
ncbi:hypothetical protein [Actinosynnema sp. NPDC023587]